MDARPVIHWTESSETRSARWRSERGVPRARRVVIADDRTTADDAYGLACQGTALLWRGDFQNARQMLVALASRASRKSPLHFHCRHRLPKPSISIAKPNHNVRARWACC